MSLKHFARAHGALHMQLARLQLLLAGTTFPGMQLAGSWGANGSSTYQLGRDHRFRRVSFPLNRENSLSVRDICTIVGAHMVSTASLHMDAPSWQAGTASYPRRYIWYQPSHYRHRHRHRHRRRPLRRRYQLSHYRHRHRHRHRRRRRTTLSPLRRNQLGLMNTARPLIIQYCACIVGVYCL